MPKIPLTEKIRSALVRHPDWSDRRIASSARGATMAKVAVVRAGGQVCNGGPGDIDPQAPAGPGIISIGQVRKRYDISQAIREALAAIEPGALILERELCQRTAGKDAARFRRAVENSDEFRACRVKLKLDRDQSEGAWYWGRKEDVSEAVRLRDE